MLSPVARLFAPLAAAALLAALALPARAEAGTFCRSTSCGEPLCSGPGEAPFEDPSCPPLRWARTCVGISVQKNASRFFPLELATELVQKAFSAWTGAECASGDRPRLFVEDMGPVACDALEYNRTAGNANIVIFRDGVWPHGSTSGHLGLTTVTFDTKTGEILDADIEINSSINGAEGTPTDEGRRITVTDEGADFDLLSILTHEAGHFLGLGHDLDEDSGDPDTMASTYGGRDDADSLALRSLEPDDVEAICAVYDPLAGPPVEACDNPLPRHGFSPECVAEQTEGSCAFAPSFPSRPGRAALLAALTALAWLARRGARGEARRAQRA